jgi:hypothetical protein
LVCFLFKALRLRKDSQRNFTVFTMKSIAAAIKNKPGLEFRDFLVENAASYLGPFCNEIK